MFRGYSVFMKRQGSARRALHHQPHLRHLRRQPRHLLGLRAEHGVRDQDAAAGRVDLQPRRGRRVHVRPLDLPGQPGVRRLLRADGQGDQPEPARDGRADARRRTPTIHGYRTIADIMRSFNPFTGDIYREALQMSRLTREMFCLMEGRHVHPSTLYPGRRRHGRRRRSCSPTTWSRLMKFIDFVKKLVPLNDDVFDFFYEALPGYEEVGHRRVLLGCWGAFQDPDVVRLQLRDHDRVGPRDVRDPGHRRRRRAGHHRPRRHQPRDPDPARQLVLRRLAERGDVRHARSARQSGRPAPPVEPDHDPQAAEARPRGRATTAG